VKIYGIKMDATGDGYLGPVVVRDVPDGCITPSKEFDGFYEVDKDHDPDPKMEWFPTRREANKKLLEDFSDVSKTIEKMKRDTGIHKGNYKTRILDGIKEDEMEEAVDLMRELNEITLRKAVGKHTNKDNVNEKYAKQVLDELIKGWIGIDEDQEQRAKELWREVENRSKAQ